MANQIEKLDGITLANIAKLDGRTDANIQALNGREFTGFTPVSPNAFTITNYEVDDGRVWAPVLGWDPDTNTLVAVWGDDDNSDYPTYRLGKLSANTGNTTITWQSAVVISTYYSRHNSGSGSVYYNNAQTNQFANLTLMEVLA